MKRILVIAILTLLLGRAEDAQACASGIPYDPTGMVRGLTSDQIISMLPEVVVEGVIEGNPVPAEPLFPFEMEIDGKMISTFLIDTVAVPMRIDTVWKGKLTSSRITLRLDAEGTDCSRDPPFGTRVRIGGMALSGNEMFYQNFDLPLDHPATDSALQNYRHRSNALETAAKAGGRTERLAFGEHLFRNDEWHRAEGIYQAFLDADPKDLDALVKLAVIRTELERKGEPENTLAELRRRAPPTNEWRGRIARLTYATTGRFEPGWLDWSNLEYARLCEPGSADLRGATFDGARFPKHCNFEAAQLQGASFRGVDLREVVLSDPNSGYPNVEGALYDCATRLPDWFDPVAAKMINVDESCPSSNP
jgi:hypothetical protein